MRNWAVPLFAVVAALAAGPSLSVPEAPSVAPSGAAVGTDQASSLYNEGLRFVQSADRAAEAAGKESNPERREQVLTEARGLYADAQRNFEEATHLNPELPGAWNMLGYAERKLGNFDAALAAYGRALALRPNFPEAIEYRGEAYLGLNRIADAKQAYLDLFAMNRELADKYLASIRSWIDTRRKAPAGIAKAELKQLEQWVKERGKIAATTAALTRESTTSDWR